MTMVETLSIRKEHISRGNGALEGGAMSSRERIKQLSHGVIRSVTFRPLLYGYLGTVVLIAALAGGFIGITTILLWETLLFAILVGVVYSRLNSVKHTLNTRYYKVEKLNRELTVYNKQLIAALRTAGIPIPEEEAVLDD